MYEIKFSIAGTARSEKVSAANEVRARQAIYERYGSRNTVIHSVMRRESGTIH